MDSVESPHSLHGLQFLFRPHPTDTLSSFWTPTFRFGPSLSLVPPHLHSLPSCCERHGTHHAGVHPVAGRTQGPRCAF